MNNPRPHITSQQHYDAAIEAIEAIEAAEQIDGLPDLTFDQLIAVAHLRMSMAVYQSAFELSGDNDRINVTLTGSL